MKQGETRIVFLIGNYAIKIPNIFKGKKMFLYGWISNDQEVQYSGTNKYLLPVIFSLFGHFIVVFPRTRIKQDFVNVYELEKIRKSIGKYPKIEDNPHNFGIWKNKLFVIDYGTTI